LDCSASARRSLGLAARSITDISSSFLQKGRET
jgi:hypothetical protein